MNTKKAIGFNITLHLILWAIILIFFACISYTSYIKLNNLHIIQSSIQKNIDTEVEITNELIQEAEYHESDAFFEKVAREKLGLVMPDEILYIKK